MFTGVPGTTVQPTNSSLLHHWGRDMLLWGYIVLTLMLFRLVLITIFFQQSAAETSLSAVLFVMLKGLQFDISTAAVWVLPTFMASPALLVFKKVNWLLWIRGVSARLYVIVAFLIFGADIIYFHEYGDQFDSHIFGIVHDDTTAILITIWKEYHPLLFLLLVTPLILGNLYFTRRLLNYSPALLHGRPGLRSLPLRFVGGLVLVLCFAVMLRGGTVTGEPIRLRHAFIAQDMFLNRTVLNPFSALRYTISDRLDLETGTALKNFWPDENLNNAINLVREHRGLPAYAGNNLEEGMQLNAAGHYGKKPRHIFVLLMESHSGWTVMPAYRHLGLSPEFSRLADEGLYFPNFLPASGGTIGSLNALITGFPDSGLNINYEPTSLKPYASSIATIMKKNGYKTRFFYGGFISWQRLDSFAKNQGFDEVYGGGAMAAGTHTNEWGVNDNYLFDFVLRQVDDDAPSFNFILTTSNHPPYDLPLQQLGYHLKELPAGYRVTKSHSVKVLGHLWYADQQAGKFVDSAEKKFNLPLFVITGDHTARLQIRFPGASVVEQSAVPLIIYGPSVLNEKGLRLTAGSHIDILPTLAELTADKGMAYTSYGRSMLHKPSPSVGLSWQYLIGENYITDMADKSAVIPLGNGEVNTDKSVLESQRLHYRALRALSWQRIKKGILTR